MPPATMQRRLVTSRDLEILQALDRTPLSAQQLCKISRTFGRPFKSERMVRDRMQALCSAGWVRDALYALPSLGASPKYYRLTRTGYDILYGEGTPAPTKRYFTEVGIARQHHTRSLADFIVHSAVAAHDAGILFTSFYRENTLRLDVGGASLYPDCSFQLVLRSGRELNFFVEVDNHTETVRSQRDRDTWDRKLRLYEQLQRMAASNFRVLILTTRSGDRLRHVLAAADEILQQPGRSLFYGIPLAAYLAEPAPLHAPCFGDHRGRPVSLIPRSWQQHTAQPEGRADDADRVGDDSVSQPGVDVL